MDMAAKGQHTGAPDKSAQASPIQHSLGPIRFSPGISRAQVGIYLLTVVVTFCVLQFVGLFLPFFLTEMLHIPKAGQGKLVGDLVSLQQIAVLVLVTVSGGLADVVGRQRMLTIAYGSFAALLLIFPFVTLIPVLYLMYFLLGAASCINTGAGPALMVDYPANESRGKFTSLMIIVQGIGTAVIVGLVGAKVPGWLEAAGLSPRAAGILSYWGVAAIALFGFILTGVYMRRDHRLRTRQRRPGASLGREFVDNLVGVFAHARRNRKFAVALIMGFAARSDSIIVLSFLSLWVIRSAGDAGIDSVIALKTAGYLLATFQIACVVTPMVFGFVADRFVRTTLLVITCALAGLAFVSTALAPSAFSVWAYVVVALVGATETALIVSIQSVMGEEAPPALRGSAMGVFAFLGSISVVVISYAGGQLFGAFGYVAPFVMVGLLNLAFAAIGAVAVMRNHAKAAEA
jgi:MFS family permease